MGSITFDWVFVWSKSESRTFDWRVVWSIGLALLLEGDVIRTWSGDKRGCVFDFLSNRRDFDCLVLVKLGTEWFRRSEVGIRWGWEMNRPGWLYAMLSL